MHGIMGKTNVGGWVRSGCGTSSILEHVGHTARGSLQESRRGPARGKTKYGLTVDYLERRPRRLCSSVRPKPFLTEPNGLVDP